ncbi:hypothetical protein QW131_31955 [Roseibium salinum]|nr:hypothetical protein [Roseibium salinum]
MTGLHSMSDPLKSNPDGTETGYALTMDGEAGSDAYVIRTSGSQAMDGNGGYRDYVINVLDTGTEDSGSDTLDIFGSNPSIDHSGDDIFLMRKLNHIPGEPGAVDPGMVALLHGTLEQARTASSDLADRPQEVERINYDSNINGRLSVFGLGGNDYFASDDTSAIMTLDGGEGNDGFQIGQLFGSKRTTLGANLGPADIFATLSTTAGELSRGISLPMVAVGGSGNDSFTVYGNQAALRLEGSSGNDIFTVRGFALAGGSEEFSTAAASELLAGAGDDLVSYNVNAPLSIDGGEGFDKVVVLGTEFDDAFTITKEGIFGVGLNVALSGNEEVREIDGLEGDDTFFVLSTPHGINTRIIGGLGNDTINVGSDVTESVVSRDLNGVSGIIAHEVEKCGRDQLRVRAACRPVSRYRGFRRRSVSGSHRTEFRRNHCRRRWHPRQLHGPLGQGSGAR